MNEKTSKINPNGAAIIRALSERKGETFAFAEVANMAGIEPKTGYLTSAKKLAQDGNMTLQKVVGGVKVRAKTVTTFPNGLAVESEKEVVLDGYRLVDGKDQPKEVKGE